MRIVVEYWSEFRKLALLTGGITATLSVVLLLFPGLIHWLFQIDSAPATDVMSGRAAMLFAGLSVITLQARNAPDSPLRRTVALGIVVTMGGLALVGIYDALRGAVGIGIFLAIPVELFFASGFFRFWKGD